MNNLKSADLEKLTDEEWLNFFITTYGDTGISVPPENLHAMRDPGERRRFANSIGWEELKLEREKPIKKRILPPAQLDEINQAIHFAINTLVDALNNLSEIDLPFEVVDESINSNRRTTYIFKGELPTGEPFILDCIYTKTQGVDREGFRTREYTNYSGNISIADKEQISIDASLANAFHSLATYLYYKSIEVEKTSSLNEK